jgi:hypothetical protein
MFGCLSKDGDRDLRVEHLARGWLVVNTSLSFVATYPMSSGCDWAARARVSVEHGLPIHRSRRNEQGGLLVQNAWIAGTPSTIFDSGIRVASAASWEGEGGEDAYALADWIFIGTRFDVVILSALQTRTERQEYCTEGHSNRRRGVCEQPSRRMPSTATAKGAVSDL